MNRLASLFAIAVAVSTSTFATPVTPPIKVERAADRTEYHFSVPQETVAPLVVVVPDTTVPLQQIVVVNKPAVEKPAKITTSLDGAVLPGGVKNAKEAMKSWSFAEVLEKAKIVFEVPETVKLDKSTEAKLIIDIPSDDEVHKKIAGSNKKGEVIEIQRIVVAKILAPDFDVIEVINDGRQVLNSTGPTEWRWSLTPKKIGEYKVNVTMSAVIEIGSDRAERLVKVYNQEVTVFVTPGDAAKYFFTKNWQWLWSTLILPAGLWFWRNRKKKAAKAESAEEAPAEDK